MDKFLFIFLGILSIASFKSIYAITTAPTKTSITTTTKNPTTTTTTTTKKSTTTTTTKKPTTTTTKTTTSQNLSNYGNPCSCDGFQCGNTGTQNGQLCWYNCCWMTMAKIKMGCFLDSGTTATTKALYGLNLTTNTILSNSQENCNKYCKLRYFLYSGVENGSQCYCGNNTNYNRYGTIGANCNIACPGNSLQNCGGTKSINIVSTSCVGKGDYNTCYSALNTNSG